MANVASVVNGELQQKTTGSATSATGSASSSKSSSSLDKEAFLQLLVTQMKYQDPLEPTDNTEYVSQLATFSELEEMQNMVGSTDLSRASSLVGKYVTVKVTNETTGDTTLKGGKVDYVAVEGGKGYLNIDGENYSVDDLDSVVDEAYLNAYNLATNFSASLSALPTIGNLTTAYREVVENLSTVLNDMSSYEKSFVSQSQISSLEDYVEKMNELVMIEEAQKKAEEEAAGENPESGEDGGNTEGEV